MSLTVHSSFRVFSNLSCRGGEATTTDSLVAVEEPLEIRIGKVSVAVLMRTPGHDDELAAGFLLTEGVISRIDDLIELARCDDQAADTRENMIVATLHPDSGVDLARLQRTFYVTSSCGVCGKASIDQVVQSHAPISQTPVLSRRVLARLPERLRAQQPGFDATGGLHAAGLFDLTGAPLCVREDVGRHNAVDKVIGWAALEGRLPLAETILQVSGRASFEIVQKALAARIPIVSTVSAPSSLAVELAGRANMILASFVRGENAAIFAGTRFVGNSPAGPTSLPL